MCTADVEAIRGIVGRLLDLFLAEGVAAYIDDGEVSWHAKRVGEIYIEGKAILSRGGWAGKGELSKKQQRAGHCRILTIVRAKA